MSGSSEQKTILKRPATLADLPQSPPGERATVQSCPRCGYPMPALKGGSTSICPNCGFKDSCCY